MGFSPRGYRDAMNSPWPDMDYLDELIYKADWGTWVAYLGARPYSVEELEEIILKIKRKKSLCS